MVLEIRILIPSGAGAPGFGGIVECLKEIPNVKIFCGDIDADAYGKQLSEGFVLMPKSSDVLYFKAVIEAAKKFACNVVLPITTGELFVLSEKQNEMISAGIQIAISPFESMKIINDKGALYRYLKSNNLPCISFNICNSKEELFTACKELNYPKNKLILKPCLGNGGRGLRLLVDEEYQQNNYFGGKFSNLSTTLKAMETEMPEVFPGAMMLCEYLPGKEYSVDVLASSGETIGMAIRLRKKIVSGISVSGSFHRIESIEQQVFQLVKQLNLHGPIGFQFKEDSDGFPYLLEINPRLQGAVSGAMAAGINFPKLAVELALGNVPPSFETPSTGSFSRYWKDVVDNL